MNKKIIILLAAYIAFSLGFFVWARVQYDNYYNEGLEDFKRFGLDEGYYDPYPYLYFWYGQASVFLGFGAIVISAVSLDYLRTK